MNLFLLSCGPSRKETHPRVFEWIWPFSYLSEGQNHLCLTKEDEFVLVSLHQEWLSLCSDLGLIADIVGEWDDEDENFIAHRHDQSIYRCLITL